MTEKNIGGTVHETGPSPEQVEEVEAKQQADTERRFLTYDEAVAMLPVKTTWGDFIHTFRQAGSLIIGCDWKREDVFEAIKQGHPELSGKMATAMKHGMVILDFDNAGPLFIETV